jgi:hypothetical protein
MPRVIHSVRMQLAKRSSKGIIVTVVGGVTLTCLIIGLAVVFNIIPVTYAVGVGAVIIAATIAVALRMRSNLRRALRQMPSKIP